MASASAGPGGSADLKDVMVITAIALAVTGLPVGAHLIGQVWGIALCAGLAFSVANFAPAAVPATLLASFLFQNLFVSLVSPWIAGPAEFNTIRGYNFLTTVAMWLVLCASYWTSRPDLRSAAGRLMLATSAVFAFIVLYFLAGAVSSPTSAAIYLRNIATPLLVFQACLVASSRSGGGLWPSLKPLGLILLAYGYAELLARTSLFDVINADSYLGYNLRQQIESGTWLKELRETGQVIRSFEDTLKVDLLNTALLSDLKIQVYRLLGPNFHSVSFAYAVAFFALAFLAGGAPLYGLAALPLLVVVGSKGALLYGILSAAALVTFQATRRRGVMTLYVTTLLVVSAAAIVLGLRIGDYHVVGLFGGINGFLKNPFGHGLGSGGNLSVDMSRIDWSRSQALGETSVAVESAVGVLLYQMGLSGILVCLAPVAVAWSAWRRAMAHGEPSFAAVAFGILAMVANALLQEEAMFAPLAMGSLMIFAGVAFGRPVPRAAPVPNVSAGRLSPELMRDLTGLARSRP